MPTPPSKAALYSTERTDWETPDALFAELQEIHRFTLDAAASASNARCETWFGLEDDALRKSWAGHRVFCNPPYGVGMLDWVNKAIIESAHCERIVMLVPSRTDTRWWHRACGSARVEFLRGRLRFKGAKALAPFPSALLHWNC